jgi:hypothetical protein
VSKALTQVPADGSDLMVHLKAETLFRWTERPDLQLLASAGV